MIATHREALAGKDYLTLAEVAKVYGYTHRALQDMARRGSLPGARKCGSRYRVRREEIEKEWGKV